MVLLLPNERSPQGKVPLLSLSQPAEFVNKDLQEPSDLSPGALEVISCHLGSYRSEVGCTIRNQLLQRLSCIC